MVLVQLPYPVIYRLGTALGRLAMRVMKSRARIARRNLELCFPEMSAADREALLVKNFESLGMADGDRHGLVLADAPGGALDRDQRR